MRGRGALVATVTRRPPPSTHYHLHLLHFLPVTCLTVILIDIPVRSAGGGLHGHFPRWRGRHRHESTPVATYPPNEVSRASGRKRGAPSSSCVAREGRACRDRYSPPTTIYPLPPTSSTLLHDHFSRWRGRHRHESTPVATYPPNEVSRASGRKRGAPSPSPLPSTNYPPPSTHQIVACQSKCD